MSPSRPLWGYQLHLTASQAGEVATVCQPLQPPSTTTPAAPAPPQGNLLRRTEGSLGKSQEKYQELYHAYTEKVERVTVYDEQCESLRLENSKLREQVYGLQEKNDQLNTALLNKNVELEEAYRQLQDDIRRGNQRNRRDEALDRLEDGLREAIISNFDLLREAATTELKHP